MGQQQLLLIVLGVIIVGIAVVVGINVFTASSASANSDAVVSDCTNLASMAQQYYRKPEALGGGGNSFADWTIPAGLDETPNGSYTVDGAQVATGTDQIVIVGEGNTEDGDGNVCTVTMTVDPNEIASTVITWGAASGT